jgi:hypothetical protein
MLHVNVGPQIIPCSFGGKAFKFPRIDDVLQGVCVNIPKLAPTIVLIFIRDQMTPLEHFFAP